MPGRDDYRVKYLVKATLPSNMLLRDSSSNCPTAGKHESRSAASHSYSLMMSR